jgi:putative FmdB family regulatory protein
MPLYDFECEDCGTIFEVFMKREETYPECPLCSSPKVIKLPSLFGFQDKSSFRAERERAILKRAKDYLLEGKLRDAQRFLEKARDLHPTDRVKRLSEKIAEKRPPQEGFFVKPEAVIIKKKR